MIGIVFTFDNVWEFFSMGFLGGIFICGIFAMIGLGIYVAINIFRHN